MGCTPDPLAVFKGPVSNLRGGKRNGRRWGGSRKGLVKMRSLGPGMACIYAPNVKSTKSEVRRAGITCKFSITRKKKCKQKRTESETA